MWEKIDELANTNLFKFGIFWVLALFCSICNFLTMGQQAFDDEMATSGNYLNAMLACTAVTNLWKIITIVIFLGGVIIICAMEYFGGKNNEEQH